MDMCHATTNKLDDRSRGRHRWVCDCLRVGIYERARAGPFSRDNRAALDLDFGFGLEFALWIDVLMGHATNSSNIPYLLLLYY